MTSKSPSLASVSHLAPPVGFQTAQGAFWTIAFSVLNKVVAFGSQIVLAWFLLPEDFGLVAMTLSITSMAGLLSGMNLKNVLIQRQDRFDKDVGQVFWLSLVMGLAGTVLLAIAAPLAGKVFGESRVVPLILLVAISNFLGSTPAVYAAVLSRNLQFRSTAVIYFAVGTINNLGAVILAACHFGPYAMVLPLIPSTLFALLAQRYAAGAVPIPRPAPAQWPSLLAPAGFLMLNSILSALSSYGSSLVIGLRHNSTVTGYYFWGFSMASQAVFLLATNLQGILFPSLAKLNFEPVRQYEAFRKTCVVLLVITGPVCILQILLAKPAISLIFHDRWLPASTVVQGLSIGLLTQPLIISATSLLLARGEFKNLCLITAVSAVGTLAGAALGSLLGKQGAVALVVGIATLITNLFSGWFTLKLVGRGFSSLLEILKFLIAISIPLLIFGSLLLNATKSLGNAWQIMLVTSLIITSFAVAANLFVPEIRSLLTHRHTKPA